MSQLKIDRLTKKVEKLENKIESMRLMHELDLEKVNQHWVQKFDLIVGIFEAQLNNDIEVSEGHFRPQTLNEFKKWFAEWTNDINSVNANDMNAEEQLRGVVEKHGIKAYKVNNIPVTHNDIIKYR